MIHKETIRLCCYKNRANGLWEIHYQAFPGQPGSWRALWIGAGFENARAMMAHWRDVHDAAS